MKPYKPRSGAERSRALWPIYLTSALTCAHGCGRVGFDHVTEDVSGAGALDGGLDASTSDPTRDAASEMTDDSGAGDAAIGERDGSIATDGGPHPQDGSVPSMDASARDGSVSEPDAAVEDASAPDAGRLGFCADFPTALACSDFSSLPPNFTVKERSGRATLDDGVLTLRTTDAGGSASVVASVIPVFNGPLYARFLLRVPQSSRIAALNLFALGEPTTVQPSDEFDVNLLDTSYVEFFSIPTNTRVTSGPSAFRRNVFQCVEVWLDVGDASGSVRVRIDNRTVINADPIDTRLDFGVTRVNLGIDFSTVDQPATVLEIDDFVLASERLAPCP